MVARIIEWSDPMKMILAALAISLTLSAPALAQSTARATGDLAIRLGPGSGYTAIGTLPDGASVPLRYCTRNSEWCLIDNPGGPDGWVRGSYLVGMSAKVGATPPEFLVPFPSLRSPFWDDDAD